MRRSLAALAGAALLALAGCSSDDSFEGETSTSESSSASTTSSTSTSSTPPSSEVSSPQTPTAEPAQEPGPPSAEPAAAPPASPTATYMDPGAQYGEVCYSGTPEQWANFVNPATGCGAILNPNYMEPAVEPYIVECLFGTPGPTLMSDGTTQYTDYCWHLLGGPEYAQAEGDATTNFWKCMEAGGTEETCRQ